MNEIILGNKSRTCVYILVQQLVMPRFFFIKIRYWICQWFVTSLAFLLEGCRSYAWPPHPFPLFGLAILLCNISIFFWCNISIFVILVSRTRDYFLHGKTIKRVALSSSSFSVLPKISLSNGDIVHEISFSCSHRNHCLPMLILGLF